MNPRIFTIEEWARKAKAGEDLVGAQVRKQFVATVKAVEGEARTYDCVISTATPDRDNDVVEQSGWQLANYLANPVVLAFHRYQAPPVGRAKSLTLEGGTLRAVLEFVPKGVYDVADQLEAMYALGFMRAFSVGFRALKYAYNEARRGYDILEAELLEFSCVPVPANPEALLAAKSAGVDFGPIKALLEQGLADIEGPGLWVPKDVALAALKAAAPAPAPAPPAPPAVEPPPPAPPAPKGYKPTAKDLQAAVTAGIHAAVAESVQHALGRVGD